MFKDESAATWLQMYGWLLGEGVQVRRDVHCDDDIFLLVSGEEWELMTNVYTSKDTGEPARVACGTTPNELYIAINCLRRGALMSRTGWLGK